MKRLLLPLILLALASPALAATKTLQLTVTAGDQDRRNEPVCLPLDLPPELHNASVTIQPPTGEPWVGQLTGPGLLSTDKNRELHFLLPELKAGQTLALKAVLDNDRPRPARIEAGFHWKDTPGKFTELSLAGKPVLRYEYQALDDSTPARREETYKVFHHLYDPSGSRLVTKGPGGMYTHHRGIYYGFMKVTYGEDKVVDIWHCKGDTHQAHDTILAEEQGEVLGRHRVRIGWHGNGKVLFAREERELTVYQVPGGRLVEFASKLMPIRGTVKVDGDPQHAGFHFRADNEVASKTAKQTIYIRPDGVGKPGETRNWDAKSKVGSNLPWNAMSFVLGPTRYTAAYLDKPSNPKEARYSERDYGRFGSYFVAEATGEKPLVVNYRVWLQEGQMTPAQVEALDRAFVTPAGVQ